MKLLLMKRLLTIISIFTFLLTFYPKVEVNAQSEKMRIYSEGKTHIKHSKKTKNRYIDNYGKKKKIKTSYKYVKDWECPLHKQYISQARKERLKAMQKKRN